FHGSQGPETGLPQMIQSRAQFGYRGVVIPLLATLLVFVGFNIVNVSLLMAGLRGVFGIDPLWTASASVAAGIALAMLGHDALHRGFKSALWVTVPVYAFVTISALLGWVPASHAAPAVPLGFNALGFVSQFAICAGYNISYAPYVSDYSRYLPRAT